MQKVSTLATWTKYFTIFVVIPATILAQILSWFKITQHSWYLAFAYSENLPTPLQQDPSTLPFVGKLLFFGLECISTILLLWAIWCFIDILNLHKKGTYFSSAAIFNIKKIGFIILGWATYNLLFPTFTSLLVSMFKPAGQRSVMVSISFETIMHFFIVFILFMILHLMQEAYKMKSEQDLVV